MADLVVNPRNIATEICGRLGLDPKTTTSITIHLAMNRAEVNVRRILTDADGSVIGESLGRFKLTEIVDGE